MAAFPLHSDQLGEIKFSLQHIPNWLLGLQKKLLMADGEMLVSVLSASGCTVEEYPLTITFQRLD